MRIVFCTDTLSRGGKERQMAIITRNLIAKGHHISWITQNEPRGNNYLSDYQLEPSILQNTKSNSFIKGVWYLRKRLLEIEPEVVMGWDIKSCFWLLMMNPFSPWVFINGSIRHGVRKNNLQHRFRTLIARLSPYVIANTKAGLEVNLMKPGKTRKVIYNAIDSLPKDEVNIKVNRSKLIAEAFGEQDSSFEGPVFLSVANLFIIKDYPTVIRALAEVDFDFRYLIVGEGSERNKIESLIRELELGDKIALLGRRSDINRLISIADIFINSSKGEGCSNAILEALTHGKLVLASRVGGTPEILPENLGEFFEFQNQSSLLNGLHKLLERINNGDNQLQEARVYMESFSNETITKDFEETFLNWSNN